MRTQSLFVRLFPAYALAGLAALAAAGGYGVRTMSQISRDRAIEELETQTRLTAFAVQTPVRRAAYDEVHAFCQNRRVTSPFHVTVMLPGGRVIGDSHESVENIGNQGFRPEVEQALRTGNGSSSRFEPTMREDMRYHAVLIGDTEVPAAIVRVGLPRSAMESATGGFGVVILVAAAGILGLAFFAARYITHGVQWGMDPIRCAVEDSLREERPVSAAPRTVEEFAPLAEAVHAMTVQMWASADDADRQRQQQEAVLAAMIECVLAVDSEERLITLNQAARDLFGIRRANVEGRPVYEVIRNPDMQQLISDTLERGETVEAEFVIPLPERRVVQARGTMLESEEYASDGVVVVLHDITHLRRLEEARHEFVANVSHELRTPITSIAGFIETLLDGAIREPEAAGHFLTIVLRQADRLNAIVGDLLTLSRLEQGGLARSGLLTKTPLHTALNNAIQICVPEAEKRDVTLVLECGEDEYALMHEELIVQAIANLVQNAVKYSEPSGRVVVRGYRDDGEAVMAVEDSGTGIEPQHLPRLFERFYRVDRARSRAMGGTGLGLAIVKHIAQAHGGSVGVESSPRHGSTFTLRIPVYS